MRRTPRDRAAAARRRRALRLVHPTLQVLEERQLLAVTVGDAGFESAVVGSGYAYEPSGTAWSMSYSAGIAGNGSGLTAGNPNAPDGAQVGFIQGTATISQPTNGWDDGIYQISFQAAQRANGGAVEPFRVLVDGNVVGTYQPSSTTYQTFTTDTFAVTSGRHTLTFQGLDSTGTSNTTLLDAVSVTEVAPPVVRVTDGSFEAPVIPSGHEVNQPTGSPWTFTPGPNPSTDYSGISALYSDFLGPFVPQGQQAAYLAGQASISQVVNNWSAGSYHIAFAAVQAYSSHEDFAVQVDGATVGTFHFGPPLNGPSTYESAWVYHATPAFTVGAGAHTITIQGLNSSGGSNIVLLDGVTAFPATAGVPTINDPGFEQGILYSGDTYAYDPWDSYWDFEGTAGVTANNGSQFNQQAPDAPQGTHVAFLQGTGSLLQDVTDWTAGNYVVSFAGAQSPSNNGGVQNIQVLLDGVVVGTMTPSDTTYRTYTTAVLGVSAGVHSVGFRGLDSSGASDTALLDQVAVTSVRSTVLLNSGITGGAIYGGQFVPIPQTVQSDADLTNYLVAHPVTAHPSFAASFNPVISDSYAWLADGPTSDWISPAPGGEADPALVPYVYPGYNPSQVAPEGLYYYTTSFYVPAGASPHLVGGQWASDNQGLAIFLNGVAQPLSGTTDYHSFTPFALDPSGFRTGLNTLTFVAYNASYPGQFYTPTGLRVEGTILMDQPAPSAPHSLSGRVYDDANNDGRIEPGEPGAAGVLVALTGTTLAGAAVASTIRTGSDGSYSFAALAPGSYSVAEVHPAATLDGRATAGDRGGTAGVGQITGIALSTADATGYNFGLDRLPTITSNPPTEVQQGNTYVYQPVATDPDGDTLHYSWLSGPAGATFDPVSGRVVWPTSTVSLGTQSFALQVDDGRGGVTWQTFAVQVENTANRPPIFTSTPVVDAYVGQRYTYPATAFDFDGDPLTFQLNSSVAGMTMPDPGPTGTSVPDPAAGVVLWTPTVAQLGPQEVQLTVSDGRGGTAVQAYTVIVHPAVGNHPPVIVSTPVTTSAPPQAYHYLVHAVDPDNDTLTYSLVSQQDAGDDAGGPGSGGLGGNLGGMQIDAQSGLITWNSPTSKVTKVVVAVSDGRGGTDQQTYFITPPDEKVVESLGDTSTAIEYSPLPTDYTDPSEGDRLLAVARSGNFPNPFVPPIIGRRGTRTVQVDGNPIFNSVYTSASGTESGKTSGFYRVTFNVPSSLNSPWMVLTANADDYAAAFLNGHLLPDAQGNPYAFDEEDTHSVVVLNPNWLVAGRNVLLFAVNNSAGGPTGLSFEANILESNQHIAPQITSTPPTDAHVGDPFQYLVHAADPSGDQLVYSLVPSTTGGSVPAGMVINPTTGLLTWTPTANQLGVQSAQVVVSNLFGQSDSQPLGIRVGIDDGTNNAPVLLNMPGFAASVGVPFSFVANGYDADGDPIRYALPVAPVGMGIDSQTGDLVWTPTVKQTGWQSFLLGLTDGRGGSALYQFQVFVPGVVPTPVFTTQPNGQATVGQPYVYQIGAVDSDGDAISFSIDDSTPPPDGMDFLATNPDVLVWIPDEPGPMTVIIDASNGRGGVAQQQITIYAADVGPGQPPSIVSEYRPSIQVGRTYLYQVVVRDPGNAPLTYGLINAPQGVAITPDGLLSWPTTGVALNTYFFDVTVSDAYGTTDQPVAIRVVAQQDDRPPVIDPPKPPGAVAGQRYLLQLTGSDPDNDPLEWSLVAPPDGMVINPQTGLLVWTPTEEQIGSDKVTVRLRDGQGGVDDATLTITVRGTNLPPQFRPDYPPLATAGIPYTYQVQAYDPEGGPLTYQLLAAPGSSLPSDLSINATTGLISWTNPSTSSSPLPIIVEATDDQNSMAWQGFTLTVQPQKPPTPPVIDGSHLLRRAAVGSPYLSFVTATAPNGDQVAWSLRTGAPSGLTINQNGEIDWAPTASQYPTPPTPVTVTIIATDATTNAAASYTYTITVGSADRPPVVAPLLPRSVVVNAPFTLPAQGTDPDAGDMLRWSLARSGTQPIPSWLTIDPVSGLISKTDTDQVGDYSVQVVATDLFGLSDQKILTLHVVADTTPPTVGIVFDPQSPVVVGTRVTVVVVAADDAGVATRTLAVNGQAVNLDASNAYSFVVTDPGTVTFSATATDVNGLTSTTGSTLSAFAPSTAAPQAELLAYRDATANATNTNPHTFQPPTTITAPVTILGTAVGADGSSLVSYTLAVLDLNGHVLQTLAGPTTPTAIINGVLGTFDPTMLANGSYVLRLTVGDGTYTSTDEQVVNVTGNLKLGNLHLSFTDLTIPVAGIPITITRSYDTLNASRKGDFGYGWTLDEGDFQLQESQSDGSLTGLDAYTPFVYGTHIVITRPGMSPEGFTFAPTEIVSGYFGTNYYTPTFIPDPGVTDKLTVPYAELFLDGNGEYISDEDGSTPYNPADPTFGGNGQMTLTTRQGLAYVLDATTGNLASVTDRNGNTLTYDDSGIYSSTGRAVQFVRDPNTGDITEIIDPRGNEIDYFYDAAGDLVGMADRQAMAFAKANNTTPAQTTFTYDSTGPAHYLQAITDPFGRTVAHAAYDTTGRLSGLTDATGQQTTTAYNPTALTESITPPAVNGTPSPASTITFDEYGNPTTAVDGSGHSTSATYTPSAGSTQPTQLASQTQVVNGQTLTTSYTYNDDGTVRSSTDAAGKTTYYSYDNTFGLPSTIVDPLGHATRIGYDADGNTTSTVSPGGLRTSTAYDPRTGQVASSTTPDGTTAYTYNQFGDVVTSTDVRGTTTTYTYDQDGNQTVSSTVVTDSQGNPRTLTTQNLYDASDRLVQSVDAQGNITDTDYDADGRAAWVDSPHQPNQPTTGTNTIYDAAGRVIRTVQYDNVVITVTNQGGDWTSTLGPVGALISVSSTIYDTQGRAIWSDDSHLPGQAVDGTSTTYNADGTVAATQRYQNVDIEIGTDTNGVPMSHLVGTPTPLGNASGSTYDAAGRVASTTNGSGDTTTYTYDNAGRQTATSDTTTILGGTSPVSRTTSSTYDAAGRLTSTTDALGHTTRFVLDADGQTIETIYADGTTTTTAYDPTTGRKLSDTDQDGQTTTYTYDSNGSLASVSLPAVVDGLHPSNAPTRPVYTYTYDTTGNLLTQTDPNGHVTSYVTDAFGNRTGETLPDGSGVEHWIYNRQGQLTETIDFDGQVTTFAYDDQGRTTTRIEYHNATDAAAQANAVKTITYTYDLYDQGGRRYDKVTILDTASFNDNGSTSTFYDAEGRVVEVDAPQGHIGFEYDPLTGQKSRTWTGSASSPTTDLRYGYDSNGRLATVTADVLNGVTLANPLVTSYFYDLDDNLVATHEANGTWEYRTYDHLNRLLSVEDVTANNGSVLSGFTYTLDNAGLRLTMADDSGRPVTSFGVDPTTGVVSLSLGGNSGRLVSYTYDADGRLTSEAATGGGIAPRTISYGYDLAGNRVTKVDTGTGTGGTTDTYTYDKDDRLTDDRQTATGSGTVLSDTTDTYDADGNTLVETVHDGSGNITSTTTNTWNIDGTLAQAVTTGQNALTSDFAYDASGNRVEQRTGGTGGTTTSYLNDPSDAYDRALEEYSGGMLAATYVRGLDLLFEDRTGNDHGSSGVSFYAVDGLGSTRALISTTGTVTDTYTYDAYGDILARTGTTTNPYQYASEPLDATGLSYNDARYYDAAAGRFTSRDSYNGKKINPITQNHYLYANANPISNTDPSGHMFGLGGLISVLSIGLRVAVYGGVSVLAVATLLSRYNQFAYGRWFVGSGWGSWWSGASKIHQYGLNHINQIEATGTYNGANLGDIFKSYEGIYPSVVSRRCDFALENLEASMRLAVNANPTMRKGVEFHGGLLTTTGAEPDNILVLVPTQFNNPADLGRMGDPHWFDSPAKKNIIFFYAGSEPLKPVGNLYDAVTNSTFGDFVKLEVYNTPGETF